jgi:serine/threonine protein kinase
MSHIGKGAYATVSLAIEKSTTKHYAIKIYEKLALRDPQRMENIHREIKNMKALRHRNIVGFVDAVSDRRKVFLIMENAGKNSLHSLLRRKESKRFS